MGRKITERLQMVLDSVSVGLSIASISNPCLTPIIPFVNVGSLMLNQYNSSLFSEQIKKIMDSFNSLETRVTKIEVASEKQKQTLLLNELKYFEYSLKEKMEEKIRAYSKVLSDGINKGYALDDGDLFDIQLDIINSLRMEDIVLLNQIISFVKLNSKHLFSFPFSIGDIDVYLYSCGYAEKTHNKYALRHLVSLGLIDESIKGSLPNVVGEALSFNNDLLFVYSLTQRCKMIYDTILDDNK